MGGVVVEIARVAHLQASGWVAVDHVTGHTRRNGESHTPITIRVPSKLRAALRAPYPLQLLRPCGQMTMTKERGGARQPRVMLWLCSARALADRMLRLLMRRMLTADNATTLEQ